jgi:hypothetical protein
VVFVLIGQMLSVAAEELVVEGGVTVKIQKILDPLDRIHT